MFCGRTCDELYHFHLSSEAQCVSHHLPLVDCHSNKVTFIRQTQSVNLHLFNMVNSLYVCYLKQLSPRNVYMLLSQRLIQYTTHDF